MQWAHIGELKKMNKIQAYRLRLSLDWFRPCGPAMIARVLRNLGERHPRIRALFPDDTTGLNTKLFETLCQIVKYAGRFHRLEQPLMEFGAKAADAGAIPAHYRIVREELLATMAELAGEDWTEGLARDWKFVLEAVSGAMLRGAMPGVEAA
jgi:hemoglobin-like flavoprotein